MIRLVALDIDDTLTADGLTVSSRVIAAVHNAQHNGIQVVLATGRMFQSACNFAYLLGLEGPLICYHGALIRSLLTGETWYEKVISPRLGRQALALLRQESVDVLANFGDDLYCERITPAIERYVSIANVPLIPTVDFWSRHITQKGPIKIVFVAPPGQVGKVLERLRLAFGERLGLFETSSVLGELIPAGVDKASALRRLARHLGIPAREVMAVGDGSSDARMIRWAGVGVAMGNASEELKALADLVTGRVEEDGVAQVLETRLALSCQRVFGKL